MVRNPYIKQNQSEPTFQAEVHDSLVGDILPEMEENNAGTAPISDADFLQSCREKLCPGCTVYVEAEEIRLRSLAEMDNFKKRLQREKEEQLRYAAEPVLADLLPSLDNLDLAIQYGSQVEACRETLMGVEMTRKLLLDAVKAHGLEVVGEAGQFFDPEIHEAINQEESLDMPEGHVLRVLQRGYRLKGRLLRPAKVSVSQKPSPRHLNVKI